MEKKLKKHPNRLSLSHSRFPHDLVIKDKNGEPKSCKYCDRSPLVGGFDFQRTINGKNEVCCYECFKEHRGNETGEDSLVHLGYIMSGLSSSDSEFPLAPKKGTPEIEEVGKCATCGKPIYYNHRKRKLVGAYNELLRGIQVHEKCGIPNPTQQ